MKKTLHRIYLAIFLFSFLSVSSNGQFCYTNLEGTFDAHTTVVSTSSGLPWDDCDGNTWTGTVRWADAIGSGMDYKVYSLDDTIAIELEDMSMGAYYVCYGSVDQSSLPNGDLQMSLTTCDVLSITGTSQWSEVFTIVEQTVDTTATILTIEWSNDYGESGRTVLTRTDSLLWLDVTDADNDGFLSHVDCDDTNPDASPIGVEIANNGVDEDCDGDDLMVGINNLSAVRLEIFPNPVKDILYLKTEANIIDAQIAIIDIHGKILLQKNINSLEIDLSLFEKGIYFLEINDLESGDKWMKKLIKD